jgi:hypothetical protein
MVQNIMNEENEYTKIIKEVDPISFFNNKEQLNNFLNSDQADNVTPIDLLSSKNYTTKEVRDERYDICKGCDRLFKPTKTCKECNCFMAMKTWLKDATCPLHKW